MSPQEHTLGCGRRWQERAYLWRALTEVCLRVWSTWEQVWPSLFNLSLRVHLSPSELSCHCKMSEICCICYCCDHLIFFFPRIKAIGSFMKDEFCVLVTASNDGFIKLWKLNLEVLCIFLACKYNTTVSWTILYIKHMFGLVVILWSISILCSLFPHTEPGDSFPAWPGEHHCQTHLSFHLETWWNERDDCRSICPAWNL